MNATACPDCGLIYSMHREAFIGPYCECKPAVFIITSDTTTTMTTPYKITPQSQPQFPCWLWHGEAKQWENSLRLFFQPSYYHANERHFTHWHPDQPHAPAPVGEETTTASDLNDPRRVLVESGPATNRAEPLSAATGERPPFDQFPEVFHEIFRAAGWPHSHHEIELSQNDCKEILAHLRKLAPTPPPGTATDAAGTPNHARLTSLNTIGYVTEMHNGRFDGPVLQIDWSPIGQDRFREAISLVRWTNNQWRNGVWHPIEGRIGFLGAKAILEAMALPNNVMTAHPSNTPLNGVTPRTDDQLTTIRNQVGEDVVFVPADFARGLERELAAVLHERTATVDYWVKQWNAQIANCDEISSRTETAEREVDRLLAQNAALKKAIEAYRETGITINHALNKIDSRGCSEVEQIESLATQITQLTAERDELKKDRLFNHACINKLAAATGSLGARSDTIVNEAIAQLAAALIAVQALEEARNALAVIVTESRFGDTMANRADVVKMKINEALRQCAEAGVKVEGTS